jgi:hypothetical protein
MVDEQVFSVVWWISAVEIPVLGALFWLVWRTRREMDQALEDARHRGDMAIAQIRSELANYKLEVAKNYASIAYLKDVEHRLIDHLLRIEAKLDRREGQGRA